MRKLLACAILMAALVGISAGAMAQELPIPGVDPAKDQPGAHEYPDPNLTYKFVFDLANGPDSPDKVNPGLRGVAQFINTLAKYNVPASHRQLVVVFHQKSTPAILMSDEYKKRNNGVDNPNIALIQAMNPRWHDLAAEWQDLYKPVNRVHADSRQILHGLKAVQDDAIRE